MRAGLGYERQSPRAAGRGTVSFRSLGVSAACRDHTTIQVVAKVSRSGIPFSAREAVVLKHHFALGNSRINSLSRRNKVTLYCKQTWVRLSGSWDRPGVHPTEGGHRCLVKTISETAFPLTLAARFRQADTHLSKGNSPRCLGSPRDKCTSLNRRRQDRSGIRFWGRGNDPIAVAPRPGGTEPVLASAQAGRGPAGAVGRVKRRHK